MKIRMFNLVPGAAVREKGASEVSVVARIERDDDIEVVYGRYHDGRTFVGDYSVEIELVGLTPNFMSADAVDDEDFGVN